MIKKILVVVIIAVIGVIVFTPKETFAGRGLPFGGRIGFTMPCSNGLLIVVATLDPKSAGPYIITPAVIPRASYSPFVGYAILGSYIPGVPCYIPPAFVIPTKGAVVEFGTSLVPAV